MTIKKNIIVMYAISLLQGMVFYSAIATMYRQAVGLTVFQITLIESISLALALMLEMPWGIVADKIGYKQVMLICNVLYFISKLVFWKADGFGMFLIERIMLGIISSGLSGVDMSILYLSTTEEEAQKVFGIYEALMTAGRLIASVVYSLFIAGDYRLAALLTVGSYGLAMVFTFFLQEVKRPEQENEKPYKTFFEITKDILHRKELLFLLIGMALLGECHQTITVFLSQLQYIRAGMNDQMIGWAYVVVMISGLLGARSETVTRKLGRKVSGTLAFGLAIGSQLLLFLTTGKWLSILAIIGLRVAYSLFMPLAHVIQNEQVQHSNRATALSVNAVLMDSVAICTNLMFGKMSDYSLLGSFSLGIGFSLIGWLLFMMGIEKMNRLKES